MAQLISQLEQVRMQRTPEEEYALRELMSDVQNDQKLSSWKAALVISIASIILNIPVIKNPIKNGIPFLKENDYYYTVIVSVLMFIVSFMVLQQVR